jgi:hypothetical protein
MPLLTDDEAKQLADLCPQHKIIIDGCGGLIGLINAAGLIAYKKDDLIDSDPPSKELTAKLGMAMHRAENEIGPLLKQLVFRLAKLEYGPKP